jgi:hypothetical protein
LEPYAATELPNDLPSELLRSAFALGNEHFFTDPFPTDEGAYVLLLLEHIEPRDRPLEEVRDIVERRCLSQRRVELFAQRARDIHRQIREQMALGDSFSTAAAALGLVVGDFYTFTAEAPPDAIGPVEMAALAELHPGEISEFVLAKPNLRLWHAVTREEPILDEWDGAVASIAAENAALGGPALLRQLLEERISTEMKIFQQ